MEKRADTADISVLQGNQQQLSFFKYFQNGQKFMKQLKPSDENIREMWTF